MLTYLVSLDGSALSEAVLPPIRRLATEDGARIVLLNVVTPAHGMPRHERGQDEPDYSSTVYHTERNPRSIETATQAAERIEAEAKDYLASVAHQFPGLQVSFMVRAGADPAGEIVDAAAACGADLIAMATHGRSGLSQVLLGSVATAVLRRSPVPVLLVRAAG